MFCWTILSVPRGASRKDSMRTGQNKGRGSLIYWSSSPFFSFIYPLSLLFPRHSPPLFPALLLPSRRIASPPNSAWERTPYLTRRRTFSVAAVSELPWYCEPRKRRLVWMDFNYTESSLRAEMSLIGANSQSSQKAFFSGVAGVPMLNANANRYWTKAM